MNEKAEPSGIGGWLILPMLGLIIAPFNLGAALVTIYYPIFAEGYWEILTTPGSEVYHPLWAPLLIYEIVGNTAFLLAAVVLLVLFFKKHYRFPRLMILFLALNLTFIGIDTFVATLIPVIGSETGPGSLIELIKSMVGAAIWIPYFLKSVRVKNTFTNGITNEVDPDIVPHFELRR